MLLELCPITSQIYENLINKICQNMSERTHGRVPIIKRIYLGHDAEHGLSTEKQICTIICVFQYLIEPTAENCRGILRTLNRKGLTSLPSQNSCSFSRFQIQ
jgi:hypothetical protein